MNGNRTHYTDKSQAEGALIPPPLPLSIKDLRSHLGIDLFTDTAAILDNLDLKSTMGCPGSMSKFCLLYTSAFRGIFSKSFLRIRL